MRIIGGSDYYDSGMGLGHDDHTVFVREKERHMPPKDAEAAGLAGGTFKLGIEDAARGRLISRDYWGCYGIGGEEHRIARVSAVVAGKRWNGACVSRWSFATNQEKLFFWTEAAFADWLARHGLRIYRPKPRDGRGWDGGWASAGETFGPQELPKQATDALIAGGVAVMTYAEAADRRQGGSEWRVNGDDLKDVQFYKVLDAYTVFQELDMWIGGVLASSGRPVVEITDDKVKIAKHGFDSGSFRKPKQSA